MTEFDDLLETLKRAAAALRDADIPFLLGGGLAGWDRDLLIDLIFDPIGNPVDDAMFERADDLEVQAVAMKVMSLEDVMVTKLLAMREHEVDFDDSLEFAR